MPYLRPALFERLVFNPLAMRFGIGGTASLSVAGRRSGTRRRAPVIPVDYGGARYLVSTRGESWWVRNLRAASTGELRRGGKVERFHAVEVPLEERPPIIAAYRQVAGRTVTKYFAALPDAADHPVFRIEPRGE